MNIYEKRGKWYAAEEGKDVQIFNTEAEAKNASGVHCECEDCKCNPCTCGKKPVKEILASLNAKFPKTLESLDDELEEED